MAMSFTAGSAVGRLLGYCPQTDPLLPLMTVNETLVFFGGLKGVGSEQHQAPAKRGTYAAQKNGTADAICPPQTARMLLLFALVERQ